MKVKDCVYKMNSTKPATCMCLNTSVLRDNYYKYIYYRNKNRKFET